jgi:HAD superfamily hydrolase (TIGR01509 family)
MLPVGAERGPELGPEQDGRVPIELVIFDCDGVLVDSERLANAVLADLLTEAGLPTTAEESIATYMGLSMSSCVALVEERLGSPLSADFLDRYHADVFEAFDRELRAVDGIAAVLDQLRWPTCVASSGEHERMRRTLGRTGLHERFEGRIYSASEVERGKPHPDLFLHAADRMGVDPSGCVVVEDSPYGVRGARAAGMTALGYAAMTPATVLAAEGAETFLTMAELPALLDRVDLRPARPPV